jgi:DNA/RNA-binding domain of Phe-tRNA-synthetase-like protein
MKLIVSKSIREKYPDLRVGIVVAKSVINDCYPEELEQYCKKNYKEFFSKYDSEKDLELNKNIIAWREIYRSFGVNPKKKPPTAEALLSRVLRSNFVPHISAAVDCYLVTETLHCLPIGGYDLDKINMDITLRYSDGNEEFIGIGSDKVEYTETNEIIYSDESRILTRRWNYKDCDFTKINDKTKNLALFVEGPYTQIEDYEIKATVDAISNNLIKYCNAETKILFLDQNTNDIELI